MRKQLKSFRNFCVAGLLAGMAFGYAPVHAADLVDYQTAPNTISYLSQGDRDRYTRIFSVQTRGDWRAADRLIGQLENDVLMGHVLFQRYMHPTAYRSRYNELRDWLANYADHPEASKIHKLALRRKPSGAAAPRRPVPRSYRQVSHQQYAVAEGPRRDFSRNFRNAARKVRSLLRRERPTQALNHISQSSIRRGLKAVEFDTLLSRIAVSYYIEHRDDRALEEADRAARRSRTGVPLADWTAGLSAWRLGKFALAAEHFSYLAAAPNASDWTRAAGGFWAARSYIADRRPDHAAPMLELAADTGATFYGMLAAEQLGRDIDFQWVQPPLDQAGLSLLLANDTVARAVALTEIGRRDLAEGELTRGHGRIDASLDHALIALAERLDLPATQMQVANAAYVPSSFGPERYVMNAGLFPVPDYTPQDGFRVDRALVFAFMRQESKFKPLARSSAGARGLMQIMPATASHITRDRSLRRTGAQGRDRLFDPAFNMKLGQQYIEELMGSGEPYGNLYQLMVAYNGGPGNLSRWLRNTDYRNDPLLFIESIPAPETRGYIERVLTNFWIYRDRLGQETPSLGVAAAGDWPVYQSLERGNSLAQRQ
ncbi:MAG: lytic transglycosylase domain-containing protein [Rhodobiaceae bacterium]|nr:lytic transglycosylase domain-containing protein [Rhodobiaceae bacterium]